MKALTLGSATIDTIAIIASERIERMSMLNADTSFLLLKEGNKSEALEILTHCGGGAVNAAVAMARLGISVDALLTLGNDPRAEVIIARLKSEGVSSRWVVRAETAPTGASVLISSHDRNAAIFTCRGANTLLQPSSLHDEAFAVDIVYISSLSNQSADCFPMILAKARSAGALVAANPGPRQLAARGTEFETCIRDLHVLSLNTSEAEVLVPSLISRFGEGGPLLEGDDLPRLAKRGLFGGGFHMSLRSFVQAISSLGPRHFLLTDGIGGAYVGTGNELLHCAAPNVPVAGTAGAGDAFTSTFTALLCFGCAMEESLRAATANASSVVQHVDTQTGLLSLEKLLRQILHLQDALVVRKWAL